MTSVPVLLIGTTNPHKAARWRRVLADVAEVVVPADLGLSLSIEEGTESTRDNARTKATRWATAAGIPALADDLGLFIHARGGFPGAAMKAWGGNLPESAPDIERMNLLREAVHDLPDTSCHLETAIAVATLSGHVASRVHREHGWIAKSRTSEPHTGALLEWVFIFGRYGKAWREMDARQQAATDHAQRILATELLAEILRPGTG